MGWRRATAIGIFRVEDEALLSMGDLRNQEVVGDGSKSVATEQGGQLGSSETELRSLSAVEFHAKAQMEDSNTIVGSNPSKHDEQEPIDNDVEFDSDEYNNVDVGEIGDNTVRNEEGYYHTYGYETSKFVSHINKESVKASKVLLVPIIHNGHWTLLAGKLEERKWDFYDSLPKPTHVAICSDVIHHFYQDTEHAFDEDIRLWPVRAVVGVPVQSNSVDCGVFVCKYMEAAIQPEAVVWPDQQH
ncbi:hypothetical protein M5K25_017319 [Dendrobium thyrsiflorum]|uniref:Ubiquitin-like protease family profile domain-containing protein n=1 Tax=Dendrobium thyrsiflorum TaxID=117978 RepID=A0ABD0UM70_DENTH